MAKQENRNTLSTSVLVRRFLPYFRKYRKTMAFDLCCAALTTVCELVLPPEKSIPIILDDALTNFDDERCAAALALTSALPERAFTGEYDRLFGSDDETKTEMES